MRSLKDMGCKTTERCEHGNTPGNVDAAYDAMHDLVNRWRSRSAERKRGEEQPHRLPPSVREACHHLN